MRGRLRNVGDGPQVRYSTSLLPVVGMRRSRRDGRSREEAPTAGERAHWTLPLPMPLTDAER
jgi:hypothetical protein